MTDVAKALTCMGLSGPLLTGYTQTLNDYEDREIDAINEPNRPIPSGAPTSQPNAALPSPRRKSSVEPLRAVQHCCQGIARLCKNLDALAELVVPSHANLGKVQKFFAKETCVNERQGSKTMLLSPCDSTLCLRQSVQC